MVITEKTFGEFMPNCLSEKLRKELLCMVRLLAILHLVHISSKVIVMVALRELRVSIVIVLPIQLQMEM